MKKLIGISGKARSGKDTIASHLWATYGFTRIAFADPMKLAAQAIFGLSQDATWNDTVKEAEIPYWGLSPRRMFQLLGNDALKPVFGNDLWIKRWNITYQQMKETDDIVVPDVRFDHEADFIRSLGGTILHLSRPDVQAVASHVSEAGIELKVGDWEVINDGTILDLTAKVDAILQLQAEGRA